jgi:putative flippase GtrA
MRLNKLKRLWRYFTSPEMILYIVFGIGTTVINIAAFAVCLHLLRWTWPASNAAAWILSVLFAFITNKLYVFKSKSFSACILWRELAGFIGARLLSLGVDYLCLYFMITLAGLNELFAKILDNVIVVIINYALSKFIIFRKK